MHYLSCLKQTFLKGQVHKIVLFIKISNHTGENSEQYTNCCDLLDLNTHEQITVKRTQASLPALPLYSQTVSGRRVKEKQAPGSKMTASQLIEEYFIQSCLRTMTVHSWTANSFQRSLYTDSCAPLLALISLHLVSKLLSYILILHSLLDYKDPEDRDKNHTLIG